MCTVCGLEQKHNGSKCKKCYTEYMRVYVTKRYHKLRAEWIDKLGGQCVNCGNREDLNFDHIVAEDKEYDIAKILSSHSKKKVELEMTKCQILCKPCHITKSVSEGDIYSVEHGGGISGKKNCRCELCRPLKNAYSKEWKKKNKLIMGR